LLLKAGAEERKERRKRTSRNPGNKTNAWERTISQSNGLER